jgi:hypothetical protein
MDLSIACTLTEAELRSRRKVIMDTFRSMQVTANELEDGFAFSFPTSSGTLQGIAELVDLERQCCPFLTFKIVVAAEQAGIRLEVTGPREAKKLIAEYFSL